MLKITDDELIDLWSMGYNDCQIGKRFEIHNSNVCRRRIKLKLVANVYPRLTTHDDFEKSIKQYKEWQKEYYWTPYINQKIKQRKKEYYWTPYINQKIKQRKKEYYARPEIKQRMKEYYQKNKQRKKEYNARPEIKQRIKEYHKKYYEKMKQKQTTIAQP